MLNLSPTEFQQSAYINAVKDAIKSNKVPRDCQSCIQLESQGHESIRKIALRDWAYTIDSVPNELLYLDLRWSNLCNFSCRTCEPGFSSEIAREQQHFPIHKFNTKSQSNIFDTLSNLTRINFTGGEPLLIKENIAVLEKLLEIGHTNCEILITTNASVINPNIIELIKNFNNVHWTVSLDGVGNTAEYIRNGTVWEQVNENIHSILKLKQSVGFNCVLSAYSVLDLTKLVNYYNTLKSQYSTQPIDLWFHLCEYPLELNPCALPEHLRIRAIAELERSIPLVPPNQAKILLAVIESLNTVSGDQEKFVAFTQHLDHKRSQDFNRVFNINLSGIDF
jgi:sulfatase maturation enzyme AslB (radical SAM superfamily)